MEFVNSIKQKIEFINSVATLFVNNEINENEIVSIEECQKDDNYFEFYCIKDYLKLIHFVLTEDEIVVDISSIPEAFIWNNNQLSTNKEQIREIINSFFNGYILLNKYEQGNVEILLFDEKRKLIYTKLYKSLNILTAFKSNMLKDSNLYLPSYP